MNEFTTGVFVVLTVLVMVVGMALVARRLLGARFGAVRLLLAGAVALLVAGPIAQALVPKTLLDSNSVAPASTCSS